MKRLKIALISMAILAGVGACARNSIVVPEFKTATEQYIFAKNLRDSTLLGEIKGKKLSKRNKAIVLAYKTVIERFPDDLRVTPLAWVDLADIHYRMKHYRKAARLYKEVLQKYPDQDDVVCKALYGAGRAYDHLKEYEKALSYYKQCYERFENDSRSILAIMGKQARLRYSRIRIK